MKIIAEITEIKNAQLNLLQIDDSAHKTFPNKFSNLKMYNFQGKYELSVSTKLKQRGGKTCINHR